MDGHPYKKTGEHPDDWDGIKVSPIATPPQLSRWRKLSKTTPSGKTVFRCVVCERESPTPDEVCPKMDCAGIERRMRNNLLVDLKCKRLLLLKPPAYLDFEPQQDENQPDEQDKAVRRYPRQAGCCQKGGNFIRWMTGREAIEPLDDDDRRDGYHISLHCGHPEPVYELVTVCPFCGAMLRSENQSNK